MITFFPDFNIDDDYLSYEKLKDKFLENNEEFNYDQKNIKGELVFHSKIVDVLLKKEIFVVIL